MAYIGRPPEYGGYEKQDITADGSTTTFALNYTVGSESSLFVSVAGIPQQPGTAYTLSGGGANIVFSVAPASTATVFIIFLGYAFDSGALLATGTITGQSALGTQPSAADAFLIYDDDAAALKKVTYSNVHTGEPDMAGNTVKVRDNAASGTPSNKAVTDTQILIGNGAGFTAAALSTDVTMTNAGAVTIAADAVTYAKMQNLATANRVLGSASTGLIGEVQVATDMVADNAVTLAKMAGLVRGKIIVGDASGDPSALTVGTADQVLTSNGTDVSWSDSVGGASWAIKTGAYTAVTGDGVMVDTDSSAITITLPISSGPPALGDFVRIMDATGNAATNNITVARNGNNIQGAAANLTIATNRAAIGLVYVNATEGWVLIEN